MRTATLSIVAMALVTFLAACNKAESPKEVQSDVAEARQSADKKVDKAEQSAGK